MKTKTKTNTKMKAKTKAKMKTNMKINTKTKMKNKIKNENKNEFSFLFSFLLLFQILFLFSKSFCIFINSTQLRGPIDGQLSLDWPRSAIAFLLTPRGLEVPQTVNSLLLGLEVPQHFRLRIFHVAKRCHGWSALS